MHFRDAVILRMYVLQGTKREILEDLDMLNFTIMPQPKKVFYWLVQILTEERLGLILHSLNNDPGVIEEAVVASVEVAAVIVVVSEEAVVASEEVVEVEEVVLVVVYS